MAIHAAIDFVFSQFQRNPKEREESGEDQITIDLVERLEIFGLSSSFETKIGGHCDVIVRGHSNYMWLAEAKVHDQDYAWLWQGFQQLNTRYSDGQHNSNKGGMLIYHRNANTKLLMDRWKDYIAKQDDAYKFEECTKNPLCFFSEGIHERSGLPYRVRHIPLSLYFKPKEKEKKEREAM